MTTRILITTDLGRFKVYRVRQVEGQPRPTVEPLRDLDFPDDHGRFDRRDTDEAGRFPQGKSARTPSGMSYGERHNEETEAKNSRLSEIARLIEDTMESEECGGFFLAAPEVILRRLLALIDPEIKPFLLKSVAADLIKAPKLELLRRFELIDS